MTKVERNHTVKLNMTISCIVCHLIHYFLGEQGLAIELSWPAVKLKHSCTQRSIQPDQCYFTVQITGISFECSL